MSLPDAREVREAARRLGVRLTMRAWFWRSPTGTCYCPLSVVAIDQGLVYPGEVETWDTRLIDAQVISLMATRFGVSREDVEAYVAGVDANDRHVLADHPSYASGREVRLKIGDLLA